LIEPDAPAVGGWRQVGRIRDQRLAGGVQRTRHPVRVVGHVGEEPAHVPIRPPFGTLRESRLAASAADVGHLRLSGFTDQGTRKKLEQQLFPSRINIDYAPDACNFPACDACDRSHPLTSSRVFLRSSASSLKISWNCPG